ncbi:hypothetical protein [Streptomyces sp. NRRL S-118]|uniref:hypothetical protein n=1 Tax=Streptomyces sp. NRRL S-118 TaxID=1463881 RepID=UPI0004CB393E|nr:hypothetical protein [Streptomyces sp. NRRL S-118]
MRRTVTRTATATAFVLATALLTGCGGAAEEGGDGGKSAGREPSAGSSQQGKPDTSGSAGEGASHEVTIEVRGEGRTMVMWTLDESKTETVTLPWKRTATIAPRGAEKEVGRLVIVTPGTVQGEDGMLTAASCTITVDGKKVADNGEGKIAKPCAYKLK